MNSAHDLGGMQGYGAVHHADGEPFTAAWEKTAFGTAVVAGVQGLLGTGDAARHAIERMGNAEYVGAGYFERMIAAVSLLLSENGVITEPWHARAFGLAVGLVRHRELDWDDFRTRLIDEIGAWERANPDAARDAYEYYERWLAALERLLLETALISQAELRHKIEHLQESDAHDHPHEH